MKDDLIGRQAAIDKIDEYDFEFPNYMERFVTELRDAMKADIKRDIEALPSTEPERKKGKWIRNDSGTYSCSLCQSWIPEEQYYYARFCLHCGADMRGEQ